MLGALDNLSVGLLSFSVEFCPRGVEEGGLRGELEGPPGEEDPEGPACA